MMIACPTAKASDPFGVIRRGGAFGAACIAAENCPKDSRIQPLNLSVLNARLNPLPSLAKPAAKKPPSPGGEGRGEGGRFTNSLLPFELAVHGEGAPTA